MKIPINETITTNANTLIERIPPGHQGVTMLLSNTFDSATATLGYGFDEDGTVLPFASGSPSLTAPGEASAFGGEGLEIYIITAGGGGSIDIDAVVTFW